MKLIKSVTLCVAVLGMAALISGCACCGKCEAKKPACGMKCCEDGKTTCATCTTCTPKK